MLRVDEPEKNTDEMIAYFGYGSLVNLDTLQTGYISAHPARLKGWRRHWQARGQARGQGMVQAASDTSKEQEAWARSIHAAGGSLAPHDLALLSVHRDPDCSISGMLIIDRLSNLSALDERERLYDRVNVARGDIEVDGIETILDRISEKNLFVYVGQKPPVGEPPLLQSYLDTVMIGFLLAHGDDGLADFIATTYGFSRSIIMDRGSPIYPRAVSIKPELAQRFDSILLDAGVRQE